MRSFYEVGKFEKLGDKANEAYRTYASLWLDFVDDNMRHFTIRGHDIAPLREVEDPTDEKIYRSYLKHAVDIAKTAISSGYFKSFKELWKEYPLLEKEDECREELLNYI